MNGMLKVAPTDEDGRIFNPVPGFSFVPLQIFPEGRIRKFKLKSHIINYIFVSLFLCYNIIYLII